MLHLVFVLPLSPAPRPAGAAPADGPPGAIPAHVLDRLGLRPPLAARGSRTAAAPRTAPRLRPPIAGLPTITIPLTAPLSDAVITTVGGRNTQFSTVAVLADWDGREDRTADRAAAIDDFSFVEADIDQTLTRAAISAHTRGNGFPVANVYYYGDSVGNFWVGTDLGGPPFIDTLRQINLPALITSTSGGFTIGNPVAGDQSSDQVVVTGITVNPVADLGDFGMCGVVGEVVYVSALDPDGGGPPTATGQPIRTRIFAFAFVNNLATGVTPAGALQVLRDPLGNIAGVAVDDDGSLYCQLVDLVQLSGGAIFKATELPRTICATANRVIPSVPAAGIRLTNYSGTSTTFGNVVAISPGPHNSLYAAVARSFVSTDDPLTQATEGLFTNPAALGPTPSMVISVADGRGAAGPTGLPVADGIADGNPGVNFRAFVLGAGPDPRGGGLSAVFGTSVDTLTVDLQIDFGIYAGLAVDEDHKVYVVSGGMPAGLGTDPSPGRGEILLFADRTPADRRVDFLDVRGNVVPDPPSSGGNVGDGDSDRFDHIFGKRRRTRSPEPRPGSPASPPASSATRAGSWASIRPRCRSVPA